MESGVNSADIAAARGRAVELPPDLIVVDDELKSFPSSKAKGPVNQLVAELRRVPRTQSVPILVAVPTAKLEEARREAFAHKQKKEKLIPPSKIRGGCMFSIICVMCIHEVKIYKKLIRILDL